MKTILHNEEWRPVVGFYGYEVSSLGRIYSNKSNTIMSQYKTSPARRPSHQYLTVGFCVGGRNKTKHVARIVAEAFLPNPDYKPTVNHKNGDKLDNSVANLEWATYKENNNHATDVIKTNVRGPSHRVLDGSDVKIIRERYAMGVTCARIARDLGFRYHVVYLACVGMTWKSVA